MRYTDEKGEEREGTLDVSPPGHSAILSELGLTRRAQLPGQQVHCTGISLGHQLGRLRSKVAARVPTESLQSGHVCELRGRRKQPHALHCIVSWHVALGGGGVAHQTSVIVARR